MRKKGFIITVTGAPATGKSYLVRKLAEFYKGHAIIEGFDEGYFPKRIIEDVKKRHRNLELMVWWRSKLIKEFELAERLSRKGKVVVTDNYWGTNEAYVDMYFKGFERKLMREMAELDWRYLGLGKPDVIIFLTASPKATKEMVKRRDRGYEQNRKFLQVLKRLEKDHAEFFKRRRHSGFILLNRDGLDFGKASDIRKVASLIKRKLQ
jgi:deoxyadenosine/deoxycytidine kinase